MNIKVDEIRKFDIYVVVPSKIYTEWISHIDNKLCGTTRKERRCVENVLCKRYLRCKEKGFSFPLEIKEFFKFKRREKSYLDI